MAFPQKQTAKNSNKNQNQIITSLLAQPGAPLQQPLSRQKSTSSTKAGNSSSESSTSASNEFTPIYFYEISQMMRGFGDADIPDKDSVVLVEKILIVQLKSIINEVVQSANKRCGEPAPSKSDFEFLLRRNPIKLQRMKRYIKDLYEFKKTNRKIHDELDPSSCVNEDEEEEQMSDSEEVKEKYDEEKTRRIFRQDHMTQVMNQSQYKAYSDARKINLTGLKANIRQWLSLAPDIKLKQTALEIISFLARETIATLVDFCILTRLNSSNRTVANPFSRISSTSSSYEALHLCPEVTQGRGMDGMKSITVEEIREALRRHNFMATKKARMGMFRNSCNDYNIPYLAI